MWVPASSMATTLVEREIALSLTSPSSVEPSKGDFEWSEIRT
jgi:hypothetical protein